MGILKMPHKGRWLIGRLLRSNTDPNRASDFIRAEYKRNGGKPPDALKKAYREYKAAQQLHEQERKIFEGAG